jgi:hypothetical protein
MNLPEIAPGASLTGLEPDLVCKVVQVIPMGDTAVQVIYRLPDGNIKERLLTPADADSIAPAAVERPWAFDGDAEAFQLACEAKRIDLAFLFDPMMAVHTSNVDPLPHQITAVYEAMLPRQPLRFVLADDPGAAAVKAATALECLLYQHVGPCPPSKVGVLSESAARIIGGGVARCLEVESDIRDLYSRRSAAVHSGDITMVPSRVTELVMLARTVLFRVLYGTEWSQVTSAEDFRGRMASARYG